MIKIGTSVNFQIQAAFVVSEFCAVSYRTDSSLAVQPFSKLIATLQKPRIYQRNVLSSILLAKIGTRRLDHDVSRSTQRRGIKKFKFENR
jgi:hypothetical protein